MVSIDWWIFSSVVREMLRQGFTLDEIAKVGGRTTTAFSVRSRLAASKDKLLLLLVEQQPKLPWCVPRIVKGPQLAIAASHDGSEYEKGHVVGCLNSFEAQPDAPR
jgi:hypothetical protein